MNEQAQPYITNCTFINNYCTIVGWGGAIHNYAQAGTTPAPAPVITNCLFWNNYVLNGGNTPSDIASYNTAPVITYCWMVNPPSGAGNVASGTTSPFINSSDPDGTDNVLMTADDGYRLNTCTAALLIDKGNNSVIANAIDIAGQPVK